jgi:hypothetical protein
MEMGNRESRQSWLLPVTPHLSSWNSCCLGSFFLWFLPKLYLSFQDHALHADSLPHRHYPMPVPHSTWQPGPLMSIPGAERSEVFTGVSEMTLSPLSLSFSLSLSSATHISLDCPLRQGQAVYVCGITDACLLKGTLRPQENDKSCNSGYPSCVAHTFCSNLFVLWAGGSLSFRDEPSLSWNLQL